MTTTFADHFSSIAAQYARYRPSYPVVLADALIEAAPAGPAWDIGCGTGQLSVVLAARGAQVIATDPAAAQIAVATPHPGVRYRVAPAEASGLPDASIALAVAAQAAHWFDWPRFVAEVGRVTQPGALVALVSYGRAILDGEASDVVDTYYRDVVGSYWPAGRAHIEDGYRRLPLPWPAVEAPALALTETWTRDELLGYLSTWSATVRMVEAEGLGPVEALHARLGAVWPEADPRPIRWPLTIKLARR